jgi:tetratricopeptide (TPR) repeat protein
LLQFAQSDHTAAHQTLEKSLSIWQELDNKWWSAFVLGFLGLTIRAHDQEAAARFFRESLDLAKATNEKWILAFSLWNIGENELYLKNLPEAERLLGECLQLGQALGDQMLQNEALRALGEIFEAKQEYGRAVELYKESLSIVQELQDITNISVLYFNVGRALQLAGDNQSAAGYFREALLQSQKLGKKSGVLRALAGLGAVAAATEEAERAVYLLTASQSLFTKSGSSFPATRSVSLWLTRHLDAARTRLGEERFNRVSAQAETMTFNQVVKYALDGS